MATLSAKAVVTGRPVVLLCGFFIPSHGEPSEFTNSPLCVVLFACAVGNNPHSIPSVWCVDGYSWNNKRLDFVTFTFQVSTHLFEYQTFRPSKKAVYVLCNDP